MVGRRRTYPIQRQPHHGALVRSRPAPHRFRRSPAWRDAMVLDRSGLILIGLAVAVLIAGVALR